MLDSEGMERDETSGQKMASSEQFYNEDYEEVGEEEIEEYQDSDR
jgi:hypothetical protein